MSFIRKRHAGEQDFELNLASIIDCFTVLITYLLVSASFISLGALDVSVASSVPSNEAPPPTPPVDVTVLIGRSGKYTVKLTGPKNESVSLPSKEGQPDLTALTDYIGNLKTQWSLEAITLAADDGVEYHEVVKTVEVMRKLVTAVTFGDRP
jgi:biopolymer transport protein ExbD